MNDLKRCGLYSIMSQGNKQMSNRALTSDLGCKWPHGNMRQNKNGMKKNQLSPALSKEVIHSEKSLPSAAKAVNLS